MKQPTISVVLCTYNKKDLLSRALSSLNHQKTNNNFSFEIIVVDDGSKDGTRNEVQTLSTTSKVPIKIIRTEGKGISHARNIGVATSSAEWIAFFDQDQIANKNWLIELFSFVHKNNVDIVDGPRLLLLLPDQLSKLGPVQRRALGEIKIAKTPMIHKRKTCSCTGNVLIRRKVFKDVGNFDETMIQGGEDWDFFRRVRSAGYEIWQTPKAVVHHIIPAERLTDKYFKISCLRHGSNFAERDYRQSGLMKTMFFCVARIAQALIINLPLLIWAFITKNKQEVSDRKCLLRRGCGYIRKTLFIISPRVFPEKKFFSKFILRKLNINEDAF